MGGACIVAFFPFSLFSFLFSDFFSLFTINKIAMSIVQQETAADGSVKSLYKTQGVCSQFIEVGIKDGVINHCHFYGGCAGNTAGIAQLVVGMKAEDVINRLEGTRCGAKNTSCPDQLCCAIRQTLNGE